MKGQTFLSLLMVSFGLSVVSVQAQSSITGTVRDADGSGSLPGAAVTIDGTFKGTLTDPSGNFRLTDVKSGPVTLRISLLGYQPITQTVDPSSAAPLTIQLAKSAIAVDEVVVSATRANQKSAIAYTDISRQYLSTLR